MVRPVYRGTSRLTRIVAIAPYARVAPINNQFVVEITSITERWIYTALFLASLVAFFVYLIAEIVRLNRPSKA